MNWRAHIACDPQVLNGKPTVKGTEVAVESICERLADGVSREDVLESYPQVTDDDIRAIFACAAEMIRHRNERDRQEWH